MFRNQYDTDVTVWSPQGHLHQIDYAMEAVKQGSACLGLTSQKLVVLCGIKRQNVDLAEHQKKVFKIDDHLGIAVAGLTADGRTLARYCSGALGVVTPNSVRVERTKSTDFLPLTVHVRRQQVHAHRESEPQVCVRELDHDWPSRVGRCGQYVVLGLCLWGVCKCGSHTSVPPMASLGSLAEKQECTQSYIRRPYGVGLLVAGADVRLVDRSQLFL